MFISGFPENSDIATTTKNNDEFDIYTELQSAAFSLAIKPMFNHGAMSANARQTVERLMTDMVQQIA